MKLWSFTHSTMLSCVYLKWALNEYPDIATASDLLNIAFTKGIIPAMHDKLVEKAKK